MDREVGDVLSRMKHYKGDPLFHTSPNQACISSFLKARKRLEVMANLTVWASALALLCLLQRVAEYVWDAKRLRRFPSQNLLSGLTNLGYIIERVRGPRSKSLHEIHKKEPVVRVGPNSVSFSFAGRHPGHIRPLVGVHEGRHLRRADRLARERARRRRQDEGTRGRGGTSRTRARCRTSRARSSKVADKTRRLVGQFDRACGGDGGFSTSGGGRTSSPSTPSPTSR